jgi:hypothetical protein
MKIELSGREEALEVIFGSAGRCAPNDGTFMSR